ncbi:MAG TPA: paraquat-inducible protein A [Burkholderiales bacterium]|nr:paraquat-inducible protein A [Burkholderiales bacterium]
MNASLIACPHCDLLQRPVPVARGMIARCGRCRMVLYRPYDENLDRPLAFTLAATVLFVVSNVFPIVGLELQGQHTTATLFGTARALFDQNMRMLAVIVFFTTILVPAVQLSAMAYVLGPLRFGHIPTHLPLALRALQAVRPWGMVEVFILGLLVSLVKLGGMAHVVPGTALWSFGALLMMIAAAVASFDARAIWARQELPG